MNRNKTSIGIVYIKTDSYKYFLNMLVSGLISFFIAYISYVNAGREIGFIHMFIFIFLFYNLYRAGEYVLTGKTVSLDISFIFGDEQTGNEAKKSFLHYITIATLFILFIIYIATKYKY